MSEKSLSLPKNIGREIIQKSAIICCPLLNTNNFLRFCENRGLKIDRERLFRLERLRLFSPMFRVKTPNENVSQFLIPLQKDSPNWFEEGWAWDTTNLNSNYAVPDPKDSTQQGYFSIFQIDELSVVLSFLRIDLQMDAFLESSINTGINWEKKGGKWVQAAQSMVQAIQNSEHRSSTAFLCQLISNRYYPSTQTNQRRIKVSSGFYLDQWINVSPNENFWHETGRTWNPKVAEKLFQLNPEKLKNAYEGLAAAQTFLDPLDSWYQLIQFISVDERKKLKGDALRAETLRSGAYMLRNLYKDLYDKELPNPNEVTRTVLTHVPELEIRKDTRLYLEFVSNRYTVNPQPSLCLMVEGGSEKVAITQIFENYFGAHPGKYGIEIVDLRGVDTATGGRRADYKAIFLLIDYLHHHQTITFLILDNENEAKTLLSHASGVKSIHRNRKFVTRKEYIKVWKNSFEFDNYSCQEIANALNKLKLHKSVQFSGKEILKCKKDKVSGASLKKLFEDKVKEPFHPYKIEFNKILVTEMLSGISKRKLENRPIIQTLERVWGLVSRNHLPTMHDVWKKNQKSKYLSKRG